MCCCYSFIRERNEWMKDFDLTLRPLQTAIFIWIFGVYKNLIPAHKIELFDRTYLCFFFLRRCEVLSHWIFYCTSHSSPISLVPSFVALFRSMFLVVSCLFFFSITWILNVWMSSSRSRFATTFVFYLHPTIVMIFFVRIETVLCTIPFFYFL